jgi:hypothetical protein
MEDIVSTHRLHRASWSLCETCFGSRWQVDGSNGYNTTLQARELGLLAPEREPWLTGHLLPSGIR